MLKLNRLTKIFVFLGLSLSAYLLLVAGNTKNKPADLMPGFCPGCNIVILDIDTLRFDAIDCSSRPGLTPNLCAVTKKAINFKNHISHSDNTRPSFVSALTSLYPGSHTIWTPYEHLLNNSVVTLPAILQKNNYKTIIASPGKTSQINFDWFDEYVEYSRLNRDLATFLQGAQPVFLYLYIDYLHFPYLVGKSSPSKNDPVGIPKTQEEYRDSLAEYLTQNYRSFFKPEAIAATPEVFTGDASKNGAKILALFEKYSQNKDLERFLNDAWIAEYNSYVRFLDPANPQHRRYIWLRYLSSLGFVDSSLRDTLKTLLETASRPTIVVVRSDHGEEFYEHGSLGHQNNLYQETIHTPLLVVVPGVGGRTIAQPTQDIDLMPTLLELVGIKAPPQTQGQSLLPLINHPEKGISAYQVAQKGESYVVSFRKGRWKLIIKNSVPAELYDLLGDSGEKGNLIETSLGLKTQLFEEYQLFISQQKIFLNPQSRYPSWMDEAKRQRLKIEGYF